MLIITSEDEKSHWGQRTQTSVHTDLTARVLTTVTLKSGYAPLKLSPWGSQGVVPVVPRNSEQATLGLSRSPTAFI
jgi:hypothetical protein